MGTLAASGFPFREGGLAGGGHKRINRLVVRGPDQREGHDTLNQPFIGGFLVFRGSQGRSPRGVRGRAPAVLRHEAMDAPIGGESCLASQAATALRILWAVT